VLEYDLMQRVKRSEKRIGQSAVAAAKAYDTMGRIVSLKYFPGTSSERAFGYAYDVTGNLVSLKDQAAGKTLAEYSDFTAFGQPQAAVFPKGGDALVRTFYTYYPESGDSAPW